MDSWCRSTTPNCRDASWSRAEEITPLTGHELAPTGNPGLRRAPRIVANRDHHRHDPPQFANRAGASANRAGRVGVIGRVGSEVFAVEDVAHAGVVEHRTERLGDQWRDREHLDVRELLLGRERQRVREHQPFDRRVLQSVDSRAREHAVRGHRPHLLRAALLEDFGGRGDRAGRVDHVVGEHAGAAFDVTHDLGSLGDVGRALRTPLVDERQVGAEVVEVLRHPFGDLDAARVGRHDDRLVALAAHELARAPASR